MIHKDPSPCGQKGLKHGLNPVNITLIIQIRIRNDIISADLSGRIVTVDGEVKSVFNQTINVIVGWGKSIGPEINMEIFQ